MKVLTATRSMFACRFDGTDCWNRRLSGRWCIDPAIAGYCIRFIQLAVSPVGAIFYIIAWNLIITIGMRLLYFKGYELGGKAVEFLTGEKSKALRESIKM